MIFAMQDLPGKFTSFEFIPGISASFNFALAILINQIMLTWKEKLQTALPLLPILIRDQSFINAQDQFYFNCHHFKQQYSVQLLSNHALPPTTTSLQLYPTLTIKRLYLSSETHFVLYTQFKCMRNVKCFPNHTHNQLCHFMIDFLTTKEKKMENAIY